MMKSAVKPKRAAFDFEAYEWTKPLCCGFACDDGTDEFMHDESAQSPDLLAENVLKYMHAASISYGITEWWAHNMGGYDGLLLSAAAMRLGWKQEATIAGASRVIAMVFTKPGSKTRVRVFDSYALVPSKLKDIAADFNLPSRKLFTDADYSTDPRTWPVERLREGCLIDCKIILELLSVLDTVIADWGGNIRKTFSSTAMSVVKHSLAEQGDEIPNCNFNVPGTQFTVNEIARGSYYGARVEIFRHQPDEDLIEYDINSSYPHAMTLPLPWEPKEVTSDAIKVNRMLVSEDSEGIVDATVKVNDYLPCLPFRPSADSGVFFPNGEWRAWFPANELRYAIAQGAEVRAHAAVIFTSARPFETFINEVYEVKRTASGALRNFAKLILNGAYGKFGENPEHMSLFILPTDYEGLQFQLEHPGMCAELIPGNHRILSRKYERWSNHAHFAIASYITAYARIALHRYLSSSKRPAYCDSDSVHAAHGGSIGKHVGAALGALKVEVPKCRGEYFAPKVYRLTEPNGKVHLASKGFPVNAEAFAQMVLSAQDRASGLSAKEARKVKTSRMQKLKAQWRKGGESTERLVIEKTWQGLSMKRKPLSKEETRPWTVKELMQGAHKSARSPLIGRD